MDDIKKKALEAILNESTENDDTYITFDVVKSFSIENNIPIEELCLYILCNTDDDISFKFFDYLKSNYSSTALHLWNNLDDTKKSFFANKDAIINSGFEDGNYIDVPLQALKGFSSDNISLSLQMIPYMQNSDYQINTFNDVTIQMIRVSRFLAQNNLSSYFEDNNEMTYIIASLDYNNYNALTALNEFWESISPEMQNVLFPSLLNLLEMSNKNKDIRYELEDIILSTDKNIIISNLNTLLNYGLYISDELVSFEERINLIKDTLSNSDSFSSFGKVWESLSEEQQQDNIKSLLEMTDSNNKEALHDFLKYSNCSIVNDTSIIKEIWDKYFCDKPEEWKKENFEKYLAILSINEELNTTINLKLFNNPLIDSLSIEQLARITNHPEIQDKIIGQEFEDEVKTEVKNAMIKYCLDHDINMLDKLLTNLKNIDNIHFYMYSKEELINPNTIEGLVNLCLASENYFNVGRNKYQKEMVLDYNKWSLLLSMSILDSSLPDTYKQFPVIAKMDEDTRKRFALLQIKYGLDIHDASILVRKYANGIAQLDSESEEKNIILDIRQILSSTAEEIDTLYQREKANDFKEWSLIDDIPITDLEKKCIKIFASKFSETLYIPNKDDLVLKANFENKQIDIYEPKEDFNMFIRSEGAYNHFWLPPKNYKESIQRPTIKYHGNCESFIGQDLIAVAKPKGPLFGYTDCDENNLMGMAPYDLNSTEANTAFSSINGDKTERGIDFRPPQELKDRTRHGHNEAFFERLSYKDYSFVKRMPKYVIWIKENSSETENDRENNEELSNRWYETKKAAAQLGVPIVMIDREYFAKKEEEKVEAMLDKYGNGDYKDKPSLIKAIITKFENNAVGMYYSTKIKDKYFTSEKRKQLIERLLAVLNTKKTNNPDEYFSEASALSSALEEEHNKAFSVTGAPVSLDGDTEDYYSETREYLKSQLDDLQKDPSFTLSRLSEICKTAKNKTENFEQ